MNGNIILIIIFLAPYIGTFEHTHILSVNSDINTIYVGEPRYITFSVTRECDKDECYTEYLDYHFMIPASDVKIVLTDAAAGEGITNKDGNLSMTVSAIRAGTITVDAYKDGYSKGSTNINVISRGSGGEKEKISGESIVIETPIIELNETIGSGSIVNNISNEREVTNEYDADKEDMPSSGLAYSMIIIIILIILYVKMRD